MSNYSEFFLKDNRNIVELETLEIYHPNFSETYRIVRNATNGITVKLEDNQNYFFQYNPLKISISNEKDNLDQILKIELGDLGEIIPNELDNVSTNDNFLTKPILKYRTFKSSDLQNILYGPLILEIKNFSMNRTGCAFEAKAPSLNINKTGEMYTIERFPMLRGFI